MMPKQFLQPKALAGLNSLHRPPRGFGIQIFGIRRQVKASGVEHSKLIDGPGDGDGKTAPVGVTPPFPHPFRNPFRTPFVPLPKVGGMIGGVVRLLARNQSG